MQNLIINANIWHTTNTPLGWAVNTSSHDVSSPFGKTSRKLESEKKGESESLSVTSDSLGPHGLYSPWNPPGQNTGVGILSLLQGIFPTQGLNPGLPHCKQILYQLSHKGKPRTLEWVALSLLQGTFPTQELNPGLPHCKQILYQLSHKGKPRRLEWVALSLLQGIFPTQELNQSLLHCRQMLYQLSDELSSVIHQDGGAAFPEKRQGTGRWICASKRGVCSEFPQNPGI